MYAGPLGLLIILGFIAFLIWNHHRTRLEKRKLQLEEQNRLFERIGSGGALTEFLQTEPGQKLLERLNEPDAPRPKPADIRWSVLALQTAGAILTVLGIVMYTLPEMLNDSDFYAPATIAFGIGVGCLIAGTIQKRFGMRWGMFNETMEKGSSDERAR